MTTIDKVEISKYINKFLIDRIDKLMKHIYVVGVSDAESNSVLSVHLTYKGALKVWDKERLGLIEQEEHMKKYNEENNKQIISSHNLKDHYGIFSNESEDRAIFNLSCEDPTQISNYPNETPYIIKYKLEE